MKLQKEQAIYIKNSFNKMKSKEDFLDLLNYSKRIVYGENAVLFSIIHINYHSNPKANTKRYVQFSIRKKSGTFRTINAPIKGLKAIQRCLNLILQTFYDVSPFVYGFVPGKSIVDNAQNHVGNYYVYNIDLKDFFPSIDAGRISRRFQNRPFNLNEKTGRKELATILTRLCCHETEVERFIDNQWKKEKRFVLPQGAPTSPILSNIICERLDFYLSAVAKYFGLKYSRYADDITFSSLHNVFKSDSELINKKGNNFLKELHQIISQEFFHINESKTRLQKQGYRQEVTGLIVNDKVNVHKRYIKLLRMWLYYWENYGYDKANKYFLKKYTLDKGHHINGKPDMSSVISGKLEYLKMVKGNNNETYKALKLRYNDLILKSNEGDLNELVKGGIFDKNGNPIVIKGNQIDLKTTEKFDKFSKLSESEFNEFIVKRDISKNETAHGKSIIKLDQLPLMNYNNILNRSLSNMIAPQYEEIEMSSLVSQSNNVLTFQNEVLSVNINFINSKKKSSKLNKTLIINKGQLIPYEDIIENVEEVDTIRNEQIPIVHRPKKLVEIIKKFSDNNSALKYSTHSWEAGKDEEIFIDLEDFLTKAKSEFKKIEKELFVLNNRFASKIYTFLFKKDVRNDGWGRYRIKFGWSSKELLDELKKDNNKKPEDIILPGYAQNQIKSYLGVQTIQKFKQVIDVFKNEIEIRDENSALAELIKYLCKIHLNGFETKGFSSLKNKNFYTDVDFLEKALNAIFENIKKRPHHREVSFKMVDNTESYTLEILHNNSFQKERSINDLKLNIDSGDFGDIKKWLLNLCDWSIESEFHEGNYRINYLVSDSSIIPFERIEQTEGFKYLLIFYK